MKPAEMKVIQTKAIEQYFSEVLFKYIMYKVVPTFGSADS